MQAAILGKKLGMTSIFMEDGRALPVTVIEAGPCPVVLVRNHDKDGYKAVQIGFEEVTEKHINKPLMGHFKKAGVEPKKYLREFRDMNKEYSIGENITVETFAVGDKLRISGTGKGHGFQGVVKRHHFGGVGMQTHGQSDRQRHPGSIGSSSYPSRVFKGLRMAGRMGGKRVTVRNLEVVEIIPERNLILLKGSVPGAPNTLLEIIKQ